jgi:hypothetical protein
MPALDLANHAIQLSTPLVRRLTQCIRQILEKRRAIARRERLRSPKDHVELVVGEI